jgi:hypothetical protein
MKALAHHGPGEKAWEDVPRPELAADTAAIVRVDATTICGTDLHILKGDVPAMVDGRKPSATKQSARSTRSSARSRRRRSVTESWSRASARAVPADSATRAGTGNTSAAGDPR